MNKNIIFKRRPVSLSIDYRPVWKLTQLLLVISEGSNKYGCSLLKLHLFSWIFQDRKRKMKVKEWINNDFDVSLSIWTLSPHVNRAVAFGIGEELIIEEKGKYLITKKGAQLVHKILEEDDLFGDEKKILEEFGKVITESRIDELSKNWK
ncbi:hypothetical protein [Autumnicola musiva]|uniref:Uncharacterized protein n=1 Tax=Autumnicola musiva TaxID=3075589 RepID=A0ABU3D705_9FLAO|nr:hypothetical protein [Zunongwangia sp. F117]MDT0677310.1 hypothetical protein [Zunongwangia sp. F117]